MFYLYHHNDLERLAELASALLARPADGGALTPQTVIVPNHGVGRWLQMQIAQSEGVCANLELPLFARFVWDLVPACLPGVGDASAYERARMRWHLYAVLPEVAASNRAVAAYLEGTPASVHRLQLAERLADVFDEYLIYRPQLLAGWEAGKIRDANPDVWQAAVWQALVRRLQGPHRAQLLHRFIAACCDADNTQFDPARLPETVICFGLGHLPPDYLKFVYALGKRIDVHFLLPNPSDGYWGDIETRRFTLAAPVPEDDPPAEHALEAAHPLLASLGRGTRDLLHVLYSDELSEIQEPELGDAGAYATSASASLLARVQAGIVAMQVQPTKDGMRDDDASVQIHACHGPLREVQVLQDQLLDLLRANPDLAPRDIVVMMPQVDVFAPAIRSVFGAARGRHYLPWSLSDRGRGVSHPIVASFRRLLDLPLSRWGASEILELAAVPAIMRRFSLDEPTLATLREWVEDAGVRWGYDAQTRQHFNAGEFAQNSWQFGLDRLLLGLARSDDQSLTAGVAPWNDLEGGSTAALGALWYFVDRLRSWQLALEDDASSGAWQTRLNAMLDDLFAIDGQDQAEHAAIGSIHEAVAVLDDAATALDDQPLDWHAVREVLANELAQPGQRQPFLAGGITFCGLVPLRAVPFEVVCLLGLNDSDFPRQEANRSFNIQRARPRLGDHSVRDDDRLLFLQALTAARKVFYVSYTGQDTADGTQRPPSPVVAEWLDFLLGYYFDEENRAVHEARLLTRQPMHPFSARYFSARPDNPRLFTFAQAWQPAGCAAHTARRPALPFIDDSCLMQPDDATVELAALRRFFDNPAQAFLRDRLELSLFTSDMRIEDSEPLQLTGLSAYQLRDGLLGEAQSTDAQTVCEQPAALWRARGLLPPPPLDAAPFAEQAAQVNALLPVWHDWRGDDAAPHYLDIDLTLSGWRIIGRLAHVWPQGLRVLRPGTLRLQYKLRAWIDYLVYRACGHAGDLRLAGLDKEGAVQQYTASLSAKAAREHLSRLLEIYHAGRQRPLIFMPELADLFLDAREKKNAAQARAAVNDKLTHDRHPAYAASDPYFAQLLDGGMLPDDEDQEHAFSSLAEDIAAPARASLEETQE